MSAAGGLLGRFVGTMGGPQAAVLIVAGGLIAGALGGGAVAGGVFSGSSGVAAGELGVYPCPNVGPALTSVKSGQKMLVTGRTEDGTWLRIHFPLPGRTEAWVPANPVTVNGSMSSVPVTTCVSEVAAASVSFAPGETMTAIQNNSPSPSPTPVPTATPSPTQNGAPSVTALTVSTAKISYDTGAYCPTAVKKVTFTAKAGDTAGVTGVTLFWRAPGASTYTQLPMSQTAGSATSGTWQATLDTTVNGITKAGTLAYYAVAKDAAGATGRRPASGASGITVAVCANTGPSITGAASSSGPSLYWDPLGVGKCQTATNITAAVSDVDGVKSVTLFFKRPGSATWSSKAMNNTTVPGKWYANLDTLGDKISIPTPPTGALSWYIKAVDGKNMASQTKAATITVRRCDSPATFYVNSVGTFYVWCTGNPNYNPWVNLVWSFSITDPDGISSATLTYTIVGQTGVRSSQTLTVKPTSQRFSIKSGNIDGATFNGSNSVTWTITTTDQYGGKSSQSSKATVTISVC